MVENISDKSTSSLKYTLLIGLGFMTTGISWSMYNTYVPVMLETTWFFKENTYFLMPALLIIGLVMTFDNIIAWIIQPWIGARSDNTWHSRWGRRMPYLLIGIPISAIAFIFIPLVWWFVPGSEFGSVTFSFLPLLLFMLVINIFNVFMASYRSPVVALMPDLVAPEDRTKANGAINLMGGLGSVIAFFGGKFVVNFGRSLAPAGSGMGDQYGFSVGFILTSIIMVVALILLRVTIKESETPFGQELEEEAKLRTTFSEVFRSKDKSGMYILIAIFLWFTGYQAMETFFSLYGVYTLGFANVEDVAFYLNAFAIPFLIMAIPAGLVAARIGRSKTIKIGLVGFVLALSPLAILPMHTLAVDNQGSALIILVICLIFAGSSWALVNINSIVIVWEIGGEKRGAYTGLYYFFSMLAAVAGPPLVGLMLTIINGLIGGPGREMDFLFVVSIVFLFLAFLSMFKVKSGELGQRLQD
ncbi:MAG: MFS transporter [Candidatus Hodarchaeales archaeon]|jgi:MFS family permease